MSRLMSYLLIILLVAFISCAFAVDYFAEADENFCMNYNRKESFFIYQNKTAHLFPDRYTPMSYGFAGNIQKILEMCSFLFLV